MSIGLLWVTLTNLLLTRNGMIGLRANHANGMRVQGVTARNNNTERFNPAPSAGGTKITGSTDVQVVGSTFADNYGTGLWFDASDYRFSVTGSRFDNNSLHGLFLEVSGTGNVGNNFITRNRGNGLEIDNTDKVEVWNNTFQDNWRTIWIVQDWRDVNPSGAYHDPNLPLPWRSQNINLHNNILARPAGGAPCILCIEDTTHRFSVAQLNIKADGNVYQRTSRTVTPYLFVWSRGAGNPARFQTIWGLRAASNQELHGRVLNGEAALTASLQPTAKVSSFTARSAYPIPTWLASTARLLPQLAEPANTAAACTASKSTWIVTRALLGTEIAKV